MAITSNPDRLLKNAHLHKREARSCGKFDRKNDQTFYSGAAQGFVLLRISGALHLDIFDQPYKSCFFSKLLDSLPLPKDGSANPDQSSSFFNSYFKVVRHPHGKFF